MSKFSHDADEARAMTIPQCFLLKAKNQNIGTDWSNHTMQIQITHQSALLTLLHSERPKLYAILAFLGAIGLRVSEIRFKVPSTHTCTHRSYGDGTAV